MLDWVPSAPYTAEQLLEVLRILRDPENGCPWDKEQTFATIAPYTLEETYEVLDAISREDFDDLRGELGDLLFAAVNVARRLELDPEQALMRATKKFMKRFALVEQAAGDKLRTMSLPEMTALWEQAKQQTAGS